MSTLDNCLYYPNLSATSNAASFAWKLDSNCEYPCSRVHANTGCGIIYHMRKGLRRWNRPHVLLYSSSVNDGTVYQTARNNLRSARTSIFFSRRPRDPGGKLTASRGSRIERTETTPIQRAGTSASLRTASCAPFYRFTKNSFKVRLSQMVKLMIMSGPRPQGVISSGER